MTGDMEKVKREDNFLFLYNIRTREHLMKF